MSKVTFTRPKNVTIKDLFERVDEEIGHFFHRFEKTSVEEDGVGVSILANPLNSEVKKEVKKMFEARGILVQSTGETEHIYFPFKGAYYQIDVIYCKDDKDFEQFRFFNSQPAWLLTLLSRMAGLCGYYLGREGFYLQITNANGEPRWCFITEDRDTGLKLLGLKPLDPERLGSAEKIAEWILESPRYDSTLFDRETPEDADKMEKDIYEILRAVDVGFEIPPSILDFSRDRSPDFSSILAYEVDILGKKIIKEVKGFCKGMNKKRAVISEKFLQGMGFTNKDQIKEIREQVKDRFDEDTLHQEIRFWINSVHKPK